MKWQRGTNDKHPSKCDQLQSIIIAPKKQEKKKKEEIKTPI